ncbi:MAG TPA: flippase-like domain-containing protein [Planctomycetes bacterium]|nr:flippase-like domain-containing protein [Planctomycetota bacterium]HIL38661.1 flippase-like domain-containing protein [Planctomycetota bacterium]
MEEQQQSNPRLTRGLIVSCVVALLIYAGMVAWADTDGVQASLQRLQPQRLFAALGLVFLGYILRFARWELYRNCVGVELARGPSFLIFLSGLALTVSPGKLGEAFKCVLLKEETGAPISHTAPIVLAERLTDLLSLLALIALANLSQHAEHTWILWITLLGCLGLLGLIGCPPLTRLGLRLLRNMGPIARLAPKAENALASSRQLLSARLLIFAVILGVGAWGLECLAAWNIAVSLGLPELAFSQVMAAFSLSLIVGAVALFAPGGLGVTEGLYTGQLERLLTSHGAAETMARAGATSATLVTRLVTLWFAVLMGLMALGLHRRRRRLQQRRS